MELEFIPFEGEKKGFIFFLFLLHSQSPFPPVIGVCILYVAFDFI